ncbi:efflux RND transporter permease subunit [Gallaecimonas xiamenensis]|uniref:Acriflavin resistance protein n=1 Tax=Gallaecimonas xiamenensis 3-C-1 TaxID=745411 RepID=K2JHH9_9GAMM|nr:efflux RND transporter permease subunit [Gallaecimonas xiamenensis]EKE74012.1 acriflavin resistance protein [Gallaecimonas xiamenensis 3-C-1]
MILTDMSVRRPVVASVLSLLIIIFGLVAFGKLPLREYPSIDPPLVNIQTSYRGASAAVVESRITQILEDRVSGIEGIRNITSSSQDGSSSITIEFDISRNIDAATNDVRDKISGALNNLPEEADPPEVSKAGSDDETIMWLNLVSDRMTVRELSDYADRYLVDKFSVLNGVARVRIGGEQRTAMRIWLDRQALAARGLTVTDVEDALRSQNVELPAGDLEALDRQFTVRLQRQYEKQEDFANLVIGRGGDGYLVKLADVARVEESTDETRKMFRGNGENMVGLGIAKTSTANTLEVARASHQLVAELAHTLPAGMDLLVGYDSSIFIERSVQEVYETLFIAMVLVVVVIYLFLGSVRAMLIPALALPVSLMGATIVLYALGYTINLLTLLALILAIGMVVDDAIVMLENVHRRIEEGESPLVASFLGARQVSFAVIATTAVLVAVFLPITFLDGDLGKLFTEFSVAMASAVVFSALVALTLSPMMCSKLLKHHEGHTGLSALVDRLLGRLAASYRRLLARLIKHPVWVVALVVASLFGAGWLFEKVPGEFTPTEDRGSFFIMINGPEGASYSYMEKYMDEIEKRLMPMTGDGGEINRMITLAPRGWGGVRAYNSGMMILSLKDWSQRRSIFEIMDDVRGRIGDLAGVRAFTIVRSAFGRGTSKPVQFVLGGPDYDSLREWRDILKAEVAKNPGLTGVDDDYKETKPQLKITVDTGRANDLGITMSAIGRTLETMLGSKVVTTYVKAGEEYDVILEGERDKQRSPQAIGGIYVRSDKSGDLVPLSSVLKVQEVADASGLNRYNRMRAITLEANLADGYSLGEALNYLDDLAARLLPAEATVSYKGPSLDYKNSGSSVYFIFALALGVVFLVLAAQFESYVHPFVIMLAVPLAMVGALVGLYLTGQTLNIYSQIGIIMLIGLAAKNGILIVEFANQLRDEGQEFIEALLNASAQRLRPILMTGITTAAGAVPLVLANGAGAETRYVIGVVVLFGIVVATFFTLLVTPVMYAWLARRTLSPEHVTRELNEALKREGKAVRVLPSELDEDQA